MALDLETFGEIMDDFIRDTDVKMLIEMPKGTEEATVTCTDVSTIDFSCCWRPSARCLSG